MIQRRITQVARPAPSARGWEASLGNCFISSRLIAPSKPQEWHFTVPVLVPMMTPTSRFFPGIPMRPGNPVIRTKAATKEKWSSNQVHCGGRLWPNRSQETTQLHVLESMPYNRRHALENMNKYEMNECKQSLQCYITSENGNTRRSFAFRFGAPLKHSVNMLALMPRNVNKLCTYLCINVSVYAWAFEYHLAVYFTYCIYISLNIPMHSCT